MRASLSSAKTETSPTVSSSPQGLPQSAEHSATRSRSGGRRSVGRRGGGSRFVLWLARIVSLPLFAFSLFWIVFLLDSPFQIASANSLIAAGVLLVPVLGIIVAWLAPGIGAIVLILGAAGVGGLLYLRNATTLSELPLTLLLFCLPHLILSVLFLMASGRQQ